MVVLVKEVLRNSKGFSLDAADIVPRNGKEKEEAPPEEEEEPNDQLVSDL